ncbi:hypothetical protein [Roseburia hominis]|uniref:hypothetical protein n=1 Tax=Roseburia hominis TaxID=301301 RepID=UPI0026EE0255|nr:hypothetical protein [Roseburia hominis]
MKPHQSPALRTDSTLESCEPAAPGSQRVENRNDMKPHQCRALREQRTSVPTM